MVEKFGDKDAKNGNFNNQSKLRKKSNNGGCHKMRRTEQTFDVNQTYYYGRKADERQSMASCQKARNFMVSGGTMATAATIAAIVETVVWYSAFTPLKATIVAVEVGIGVIGAIATVYGACILKSASQDSNPENISLLETA